MLPKSHDQRSLVAIMTYYYTTLNFTYLPIQEERLDSYLVVETFKATGWLVLLAFYLPAVSDGR